MQARVERDALGARAIPAAALYGIHTARAVENLSFSSRPLGGGCPPYLHALAVVKRAAARASLLARVLDPAIGDAIVVVDEPGKVTVNELIVGVNIALGNQPITACPAFNPNGSGTVIVTELIQAVNNALYGCPT